MTLAVRSNATDCVVVPKARNRKPFIAAAGPERIPARREERHERSDCFLIAFSPGLLEDPHFSSPQRKAFV